MSRSNEISPLAWFLLIILTIIWGASFLLIKKSLLVFTPIQLSYLRISVSFLFLLPFAIIRWKEIKRADLFNFFIVGFIGSAVPSFLFAYAQQEIPSFVAGMLNALTPLWTIIFSRLLFKKQFSKYKWLGILIGFLGTLIIFYDPNGSIETSYYLGMVVLATLCYALSANVISHKLEHLHTLTISSASFMIIGPIAILMFLREDYSHIDISSDDFYIAFWSMMCLGVLATAVGLILLNKLIHISNVVFATSITYLIPIIAIILGVTLLDEELIWNQILGSIVILLAVYLVKKK